MRETPTFIVRLSDGSSVDVCTASGANAFMQDESKSKEYLSVQIERMSRINAKSRLNAKDKNDLKWINGFLCSIATCSSREVFQEHFEKNTIKSWLDHAIGQIKRFTTSHNWINNGQLPSYDTVVLLSCMEMTTHTVPVSLMFESEFFNALANFVKARKGTGRALPCDNICYLITMIVSKSFLIGQAAFRWMPEKVLKQLEATGVLEQFIRCATIPRLISENSLVSDTLDAIQECQAFTTKKLRRGKPCGDLIIAIIDGRDGSENIHPSVVNKLQTMIRIASSVDPGQERDVEKCKNCCKMMPFESLMVCNRCHRAQYCNRECQRSHWKLHKKVCIPITGKVAAKIQRGLRNLFTFCQNHYVAIMVKMVKTCVKSSPRLSKNDMLVTISFMANREGIVPAMLDKPKFQIAPVKEYIEGTRPAEPDWFDRYEVHNQTCYEENRKTYLKRIQESHDHLQPHQMLVALHYEGALCAYPVELNDTTTKKPLFTQEAVLAFEAYMDNHDDGPLSKILANRALVHVKRQITELCKMCQNCDKMFPFESLMVCNRCHQALYCSSACQRSHWQLHQKVCIPTTGKVAAKIQRAVHIN